MIRPPEFAAWERTSPTTRAQTLLAVFLLFSTLGWITDLFKIHQQAPLLTVLLRVFFDGLVSAGWAYTFMRDRRFIFLLLPLQLGIAMLMSHALPPGPVVETVDPAALQPRLIRDGLATLASIALSYGFFIRVIAMQGIRQVRLQTEVDLARNLHSRLAPSVDGREGGYELYGRSIPSSEIGGDLLDVVPLDGGVFACVADVSGHGIAAGTLMGMLKSAIRMRLTESRALPALMDDLNAVLMQVKGNNMFATAACVWLDGGAGGEAALAGHLPLLVYRAATRSVEQVDNQHLPLGIDGSRPYGATGIAVAPGDVLAFYTDGLTEAASRAGEEFGIERVAAVLRDRGHAPLSEIGAALFAAVDAHGPREDDQTLLLIRRADPTAPAAASG